MHRRKGRLGLRYYVLYSLLESPKNGMEIAHELFRLMGWRPSPGSLYPLLFELEKEGLIEKTEEEKFRLTPFGMEHISSIPLALSTKSIIFVMETLADRLIKLGETENLSDQDKDKVREIIRKLSKLLTSSPP